MMCQPMREQNWFHYFVLAMEKLGIHLLVSLKMLFIMTNALVVVL